MKTHLRVSNPLSKPLMIWDGECHFCRRWIERWREITAGEVDYATYQEAADRFPEIPLEQFQRAVGLIYLIAFVSLWVQLDGLIGANGISPVNQFLPAVHEQLGRQAYSLLPTLCWFNSSNTFLHFLCGAGVAFSLLLVFGIAPVICLTALFVFYLSLTISGQTFLSFQWDILLLETGFLSIFLAPWQLWPKRGQEPPVSRAALLLLKLLLFKLMVMSGVVKLTSG